MTTVVATLPKTLRGRRKLYISARVEVLLGEGQEGNLRETETSSVEYIVESQSQLSFRTQVREASGKKTRFENGKEPRVEIEIVITREKMN